MSTTQTNTARLEHVNLTVADPADTGALLCRLFDWEIRWEGPALNNGYTVHVGSDSDYVALYSVGTPSEPATESYQVRGGLNHIGIVVDDLDAVEQRVISEGYTPTNHGSYEPGRRFYFVDKNTVEYEIVSYSPGR